MSKLTPSQVEEARTRYHVGGETFAALARVFGVARSTITKAITGVTWKEIPPTYRRPRHERNPV